MSRDNAPIADDATVVLQTGPMRRVMGVMSGQLYRETIEDTAGMREAWRKLADEAIAEIESQIFP